MNNSARFPNASRANILRDLKPEEQSRFIDSCQLRSYKRGSVILNQGDPTSYMMMIAEGRVEVSYLSETGYQSIIYHAFPGGVLGAVETLSGRPCAGTCKALVDTAILMCKRTNLYEMMRSPIFVRNQATDLHDVLVHDNRYKSIDQFFTAEQKICVYLEKLSAGDATVFMESQSYLADVVGCSRQTVNKELGRLRQQGVIETTKTGVRILDYAALSRRLAELGGGAELRAATG
ncbi:Crp/Fnr family transcriptional regulator [uncultured Litoreibacter sp.]|uniref:Crp/Fnr family transcriptional regulator n=1 Tax=uncultured Litoreibacter sp. TaxID=1392394 RepID=UPI002626E42B|nr:Crp/Fnr family transcriptional regulator [uncultured Litoreibacter sp.]